MKAIKISIDNKAAIEAALKEVNGRSVDHAYTSFDEISHLADTAEFKLDDMGLPLAQRKGALWAETSGGKVPNSYKGISRNATTVKLERRATGWFMIDVRQTSIFKQGGGPGILSLTTEQAAEVTRRFQAQFCVLDV